MNLREALHIVTFGGAMPGRRQCESCFQRNERRRLRRNFVIGCGVGRAVVGKNRSLYCCNGVTSACRRRLFGLPACRREHECEKDEGQAPHWSTSSTRRLRARPSG